MAWRTDASEAPSPLSVLLVSPQRLARRLRRSLGVRNRLGDFDREVSEGVFRFSCAALHGPQAEIGSNSDLDEPSADTPERRRRGVPGRTGSPEYPHYSS